MSKFINSQQIGTEEQKTLVMLHGWRQSLESLKPLGELLSEGRRVILLDLAGFGKSEEPEADWGTESYAKSVLETLDSLGVERASFLGHSFGGKVSLWIASHFPKRVERLILIGASGIPPKRDFRKRVKMLFVRRLGRLLKFAEKNFGLNIHRQWFVPRFGSADYLAASGNMRSVFVRIVNEDLSQHLGRISAPALLLWGENDTESPPEIAERMARLIPDSRLIILPGKDHFPFLGAGASVLAYQIKNFFSSSREAASGLYRSGT